MRLLIVYRKFPENSEGDSLILVCFYGVRCGKSGSALTGSYAFKQYDYEVNLAQVVLIFGFLYIFFSVE